MSKYVAYSPNGTAYQCDTLAEVRQVEGGRKRRKKRNGGCGCQHNPRHRRRNPSEDYSLGLFQGAMEHGKLPPPKTASGEFRKGYADGFKVGRSKPEARAQALGVFKGTGSQRQGGEALYEMAQGESTLQNPRKRRNPSLLTVALVGGAAYAYAKSAKVRKHAKAAAKGAVTGVKAAYGAYKHHAKKVNPMSAAERKHLAHEKSEEATFATMLDKLPIGVTIKAGKHRVRKLSKGYVVVDGVRLTDKEAAKKIHRG